ncbi:hypothetical protein Acy02nite_91310 [Actinoplanes cyaneus]|uniref:Uncharacterized protein n=1 Tax=Actinoplanes cyaneus TaxID=52696 RepID=A0A919IS78_9ACTN|nr:hypothetical protein Acy02nite_91310 [Actinoplanes cyaneus]
MRARLGPAPGWLGTTTGLPTDRGILFTEYSKLVMSRLPPVSNTKLPGTPASPVPGYSAVAYFFDETSGVGGAVLSTVRWQTAPSGPDNSRRSWTAAPSCDSAVELVRSFAGMMTHLHGEQLTVWITADEEATLPDIGRFTTA